MFFDWNPIYENDYITSPLVVNKPYQKKSEEEINPFAKLLKQNNKLQVLFLRADNLQDSDIKDICHVLKPDPA